MKKEVKYMKKVVKFFSKYAISIVACTVMALLSFGIFFATGQGGGALTSIGQNLSIAGGLQLNVGTSAKPTCNEANRGTMWTEKGGSGEQDIMVFCGKHSDGTFQWQTYASMWKGITATGGDSVYTFVGDGINGINGVTYRVHMFTTVGGNSFVVTDPGTDGEIEYLIVAGGGGSGGKLYHNGGGGAGGYITSVQGDFSVGGLAPQPKISVTAQTYPVVVGQGGVVTGNYQQGGDGGNSSVFGKIAIGGGGAGNYEVPGGVNGLGRSGGSGGGAGTHGSQNNSGGTGTSGQGTNGGSSTTAGHGRGSGGGGAGAAGGANTNGGHGGIGLSSSIISSSLATAYSVGEVSSGLVYFAGGGGGSDSNVGGGNGGIGGGGAGNMSTGNPGRANTGGGAGGAERVTGTNIGVGGSGIVIIRYPITNPNQ